MIAFSFTECAERRDWTTLRFMSISWRRRKKKLRYNFQKCPKGPKSPRSYFFDISDIYLWPSCSLSLWEILRLYLKGFYLDIYRYWEIDKIYWSLHELGPYPSHSSEWVSLTKIARKGSIIVFLWISRRNEIKS